MRIASRDIFFGLMVYFPPAAQGGLSKTSPEFAVKKKRWEMGIGEMKQREG